MRAKKNVENLFSPKQALNPPQADRINETSGDAEIAEWAKDKPFLLKRSIPFSIDNKLADDLEQVTKELQATLPENMRNRLNFSKLGEICFRELVDEYRRRRKKERSVLVQIVRVWSEENEKAVGKNEPK